MAHPHRPATLLGLPQELREEILSYVLHPSVARRHYTSTATYHYDLRVLRVCQHLHRDALAVFRRLNVFIKVTTPWVEAEDHVTTRGGADTPHSSYIYTGRIIHRRLITRAQGTVPFVLTGRGSGRFPPHVMTVRIDAQNYDVADEEAFTLILLLDDLPNFTQMWHLSALTYPGLNEQLRLRLHLHDLTNSDPPVPLPLSVQERVLLPFGAVKRLQFFSLTGTPPADDTIAAALHARMAEPYPSPEACIARAYALGESADAACRQGDYRLAIDYYDRAFDAIHIVSRGNRRTIWAEAFYQSGGFPRNSNPKPHDSDDANPDDGNDNNNNNNITTNTQPHQQATPPHPNPYSATTTARKLAQVRLEASRILMYLQCGNPSNARFWGFRSILTLGLGLDGRPGQPPPIIVDHHLLTDAADALGRVYYRTAFAVHVLDEREDIVRMLLRAAAIYLPNDPEVQLAMEKGFLPVG